MADHTSTAPGDWLGRLGRGARVGDYVIEEQVGAGGMAMVFRARDTMLGRLAAMKVMAPALAADEEFRLRFIRESRATALLDEPHVIPVYAAGEADGVLYIATKFVAGGDLRGLLDRAGPLPASRAVAIVAQVASALDAAHAAGLVHRDVKPANILMDTRPDGSDHAYLSDFGLSKGALFTTDLTPSGQFLGTPGYSAPEQVSGGPVDSRTDQYALACVAFALLTGGPPFRHAQAVAVLHAQLFDPPPALTAFRPELPPAADAVLAQAMAKAPQDRYHRCGDFADALRQALGASAGSRAPGTRPRLRLRIRPRRPQRVPAAKHVTAAKHVPVTERIYRLRWVAAGTAALILAIVSLFIAAPTRPNSPPARAATVVSLAGTLPVPGGDGIQLATFSGDGRFVAAVGVTNSKAIYLWNTATRKYVSALIDPAGGGYGALAFSADGKSLVAAGYLKAFRWNLATRHKTAIAGSTLLASTLTPDGSKLATVNPGGIVDLRNLGTGASTHFAIPNGAPGLGQSLDHDGGRLAVSGESKTYVWNTSTKKVIAVILDAGSQGLTLSPDGRTLAMNGMSGASLWDVTTHTRISPRDPHWPGQGVAVFAFSKDSKVLATGYGNETDLWNVATHTRIATVPDPQQGEVSAVALSPDGRTLLTANQSTVYLWHLSPPR